MLTNINIKTSDVKAFNTEMDDGGRCLLDVINDPQQLQLFLQNSSTTNAILNKNDNSNTSKIITNSTANSIPKSRAKGKKSNIVAKKSSPIVSSSVDINASKVVHYNAKNIANLSNQNTLKSGIIMDNKQTINVGQSPVGIIPFSLSSFTGGIQANAQSITNQMRGPSPNVYSQIQLGPRPMTVLPQQLIMPGVQMSPQQQGGLPQFVLTSRSSAPNIQSGQVLQIIQTSQGAQIVSTNPNSNIQQMITTTSSSTKSTNSRSNKQILPKPLSAATVSVSQSNPSPKSSQSNNIKLLNSIQQQPQTTFSHQSSNVNNASPFLFSSGAQHANIITGPQGTFILNNMLPNMGGQQFLFQGNVPNSPLQLAIRPQAPLFVNNSINNDQTNLSLSLSNNPHVSTNKPQPTQSPQTFVFSNPNTPVSNASNGLVYTQNIRPNAQNFFIRPQILGTSQSQQSTPQLLQLQTPNGPILVAVNSGPQLGSQTIIGSQGSSNMQPQALQFGNTVISLTNPSLNMQSGAHSLQSLISQQQENATITNQNIVQHNLPTSVSTSTPLIINSSPLISKNPPIVSQSGIQVVGQKTPKTNLSKGLNLADLLKETGILSDFSPPSSPKNLPSNCVNTAAVDINMQNVSTPTTADLSQSQNSNQTVLMVPGGMSNTPQNLLISPNSASSQLRFSLAPDGTLVLLSPNSNSLLSSQVQTQAKTEITDNSNKDPSGLGSSQPSPDSTTPSIDTATSSPSTSVSQSVCLTSTSTDKKCVEPLTKIESFTINKSCSLKSVNDKPSDTKHPQSEMKSASCNQSKVNSTNVNIVTTLTMVSTTQTLPIFTSRNFSSCDTSATNSNLNITNASLTSQKQQLTEQSNVGSLPKTCVVSNNGNNYVALQQTSPCITLIDQKGVALMQVNSNNKEFVNQVESQLKNLLAIKSPTGQQKELIQELLNIQQKLNLINSQSINGNISIHINISPNAQQLLQIFNSIETNQQITLSTNQFGNILISPNQSNSENIKILANNKNKVKPNSIQLVPNSVPNNLIPQSISNQSETSFASSAPSNVIANLSSKLKSEIDTAKKLPSTIPVTLNKVVTSTEKSKPNVLKAIQQQWNADQNAALYPDCKTPFKSRDDACKRLLRYHVFDWSTWSKEEINKFDSIYEGISDILLHKKSQLYDKYQYLLLKQSMKESPSCEHVMLGRMFVNEEMNSLKADKEYVQSGKSLNLPPLPETWFKVEQDEEESCLNISTKRKYPNDEFDNDYVQSTMKQELKDDDLLNIFDDERSLMNSKLNILSNFLPDDSNLNNNRSHEITSVDELINQLSSRQDIDSSDREPILNSDESFLDNLDNVPLNQNSYMDSESSSLNLVTDDLDAIYSGINDNDHLHHSSVGISSWSSNLNCHPSSNTLHNHLINNTSDKSNSQLPWDARYNVNEAEAEVAVQSIIDSPADDTDMSVDLSGIEDLEANISGDNPVNFDDDDDGSSYLDSDSMPHQQNIDVQMNCAIKSIMMPSPTGIGSIATAGRPSTSNNSNNNNSYHSHQQQQSYHHIDASINSTYSNLSYHHQSHQMMPNHHHLSMRTNNMMSYQSTSVNDPMLDEAVKSILS